MLNGVTFTRLFSIPRLLGAAGCMFAVAHFAATAAAQLDRQNALSWHRLSSGGLAMMDRDGEFVTTSRRVPAWMLPAAATAAVMLDLRVGNNILIGGDPPQLPPTQLGQAEPHIVRSPTNPDFLVATFQEGRFATSGGALDCGYAVSRDGGLTWTRSLIPGLTRSFGGPYFRATDPVAAMDLNGNIFLNTQAANNSTFTRASVVVSRSSDGGATFAPPVAFYVQPNLNVTPDKPWFAVNTFAGTPHIGRIFATFTLFTNATMVSPIVASYSDNAGVSWTPIALTMPAGTFAQGSQPVFLPDGRLALVYWNFGGVVPTDEHMEVIVSNDGGVSFGAPVRVASAIESAETGIRSGAFLPSAATDRTTSNIYVVYTTATMAGPRVMFTKSTNAGASWSAPVPVSDDPAGVGVFNAAIAASPDGQTLTVSFYDRRNNPASTTLVDLYYAQSQDGGATWQPNIRLTSVSSDAALAPLTSEGYMLGDYLGIAPSTGPDVPAVPIWVDTRTGNPDPFVTRVGIAPVADFRSWQAARLSLAQIDDPQLGGPAGDADHDGEDNQSEFTGRHRSERPRFGRTHEPAGEFVDARTDAS